LFRSEIRLLGLLNSGKLFSRAEILHGEDRRNLYGEGMENAHHAYATRCRLPLERMRA
jgi:hypothetical protein